MGILQIFSFPSINQGSDLCARYGYIVNVGPVTIIAGGVAVVFGGPELMQHGVRQADLPGVLNIGVDSLAGWTEVLSRLIAAGTLPGILSTAVLVVHLSLVGVMMAVLRLATFLLLA